ncbi:glycosyltransferase family 2 protein [Tamlana crocina]|uniref:Glycosyltransferase n=1 Tax=Tamlana crocina TaxID=393006 RepID=A0ABX1DA66_9FLAO|nr:glycosyltransferase [Tamlana crocina]NJX15155.1 glycosyltransferase [Tamlana crocina]
MSKPLISIIIPVFNSQEHLEKCLSSILNQTFKDFEIIIINDGSTDNSLSICESFEKNHNNIKIYSQNNAGVSIARNNGLDKASGSYICFVDSDDWLDEKFLENFDYSIDSDLQMQGLIIWKEDGNKFETIKFPQKCISNNIIDAIELAEKNNIIRGPYVKLFKSSIIKTNNLNFNPDIAYGEDMIFVFEYLMHISTISITSYAGYYYAHRNNESLTNKYIPFNMRFKFNNEIISLRDKFLQKHSNTNNQSYIDFINYSNAYSLLVLTLGVFDKRSCFDKKERQEKLDLIKKEKINLLYKSHKLPRFFKLIRFILKTFNSRMSELFINQLIKSKNISY